MTAARLPPGPKGHWLTGSLAEFRSNQLDFYSRCAREHGDCVSFRLGTHRLVLVSHPSLVEEVLTNGKLFGKRTYILNLLVPFLGNSLLISEGEFWLRQRRMIQPEFQRQRLADYGVTMIDHANRLVERWRDGEQRDLAADMNHLALEIVAQSLFSADVSAQGDEVGAALSEALAIFLKRWESFLPLPAFIPTPLNLRMKRVTRRLDRIVYRLIEERRRHGAGHQDLLSRLMHVRDQHDGQGMSDRQLRDEVLTLFLAGFETTANALAWTWHLLGRHPAVEARLVDEVRGIKSLTAEAVTQLPYARSVFQEAMRLYPPVYAVGRIALTECALGGFRVPRGATALVSQWVTQRDGRFFADPLAFRPERWLDEKSTPHPYAYFPFGGGPRICIGKSFAMMEGPLILAALLARVRITPLSQEEVQPYPSLTLRPGTPILATVHKR